MKLKFSNVKKALTLTLAFVMVFAYFMTAGIGTKENWRAYAADNGNAQYSLSGAVYWVYTNSSCTTRAKDADGEYAVLVTGADGTTAEVELDAGTYYVKEKQASKGYILDTSVYKVNVKSDETVWVNGNPGVKEVPQSAPFSIQKIDKETGQPVPMGGASLEGAQFKVSYTDGANITKEWVIKTDADGIAKLDDAHKVSGPDLYKNSQNQAVLPLGRATVTEVEPSTGYLKNTGSITVTIGWDGNTATNETTSNVSASGGTQGFALGSTKPIVVKCPEQVKRGDVKWIKMVERTADRLQVPFVITSATTGESHVVFTDENGFITTHASSEQGGTPHSERTNGNDAVINSEGKPVIDDEGHVDTSVLKNETGIWFSKDKEGNSGSIIDDNSGALPYDTYYISELPTALNDGYVLIKDIKFVVSKNLYTIEGGTFDNQDKDPEYDMYKVRVDEAAANSEGKYGFQPGDFVTYDVFISNPNATGTLTLDVSDEFVENAEYFSKPVVVGVENAKQNKLSDDKNTVNITIDPGLIAKVTYGALVLPAAKEKLADAAKDSDSQKENQDCNKSVRDNEPDENDGYRNMAYTTNVKYKPEGSSTVKELEPKEDDAQTPVKEPKIGTTLADDAARKVVSGNPATLVDTVSYEGLTPGKTYVIEGTLMVKDTADPLVENGEEVKAVSDEFVPTTPNGEATVTFTVNLDECQGKELVAFETAYVVKDENGDKPKDENGEETDKNEVAKHEDIDDPAQTVEVPGYKMYKIRNEAASAKGNKFGFEPGSTVTYDVVIENFSKSAFITMDVTDKFVEKAEYFTTPEVVEVKNAIENSRSEDGNKVNITVKAGETAVVTYAATISEDAKEYLAKAAKDSDHLDADGNATNHTTAANKPDNKDGYKNVAEVENPTPQEPDPENPDKPKDPDPDNPTPPLPPSDDEAQTPVKEPEIGTYLADDANRKVIGESETTVLIDTVAYKGLTPGQKYAVVGELIVKESGDPLVENGERVAAVGTFTAEEESGSIDVEFVVNTKGMAGKHLVAFETAYNITGTDVPDDPTPEDVENGGKKIAEHKNLKDKDQTVLINEKPGKPGGPRKTPSTGDDLSPFVIYGFAGLLAAALALMVVMIKRRRAAQR